MRTSSQSFLSRPVCVRTSLAPAVKALGPDATTSLLRLHAEEAALREWLQTQRDTAARELKSLRRRLWQHSRRRSATRHARERERLRLRGQATIEKAIAEARAELTELALSIARAVVQAELSTSSRSLLQRLQSALDDLPTDSLSQQPYSVSVAERDLQSARRALAPRSVAVTASPEIAVGDFAIITPEGTVVSTWTSSFQAIAARLREAVVDPPPPPERCPCCRV